MQNIVYRKLSTLDKTKLINFDKFIESKMERPDFILPYSNYEIENLFNPDFFINFGASEEHEINKNLVGSLSMYVNQQYLEQYQKALDTKDRICMLRHAMVHPEHQRKGIMRTIVGMAEEEAVKMDMKYSVLTIHPENYGTMKATAKMGYEDTNIEVPNPMGDLRSIYCKEL